MPKLFLVLVLVSIGLFQPGAQAAPAPAEDLDSIFKPMLWRSIGPFRGGRSNAATGVVGDPRTYYMGTTGAPCGRPGTWG